MLAGAMPPWWRLAISGLSAKRGRTALLVACVALCAALVVAVRSAIASLNEGFSQRIEATIGAADLRVVHPGKAAFDAAILQSVRAWPETQAATGRLVDALALRSVPSGVQIGMPPRGVRVIAYGVEPIGEQALRPMVLLSGRWLDDADRGQPRIVLDQRVSDELEVQPGDFVEVQRFGEPLRLQVVGVVKPPPLSGLFKNILPIYGELETISRATERFTADGGLTLNELDIKLRDSTQAEAIAEAKRSTIPAGLLLQPTEKITSGFTRSQQSGDVGLLLASIIAFLASGFIIATGMTTAVGEKLRELAIVRAVGGTRAQLALSQLATGAIVGAIGALIGVPIGLLGAWWLINSFPDQLPAGFIFSLSGVLAGVLGSVLAGMVGAGYSAWVASRVSPMAGLAARAKSLSRRAMILCLVVGLLLIGLHAAIVATRGWPIVSPTNADAFFWLYAPLAAPAVLTGYFLLSIPLTYGVAVVLGPIVGPLLRLGRSPRVGATLLTRAVTRTPVRSGLTAGSMMLGLSLLISIWTNGKSVLDSWLDQLSFPDAFVTGLSLRPDVAERVRKVPGVADATAVTLFNVETDAFGIDGLTRYRTTFLAFEPEPFFAMTRVQWIEGDLQTAKAALIRGGAVIVAREFRVTRGLGVGDTITLKHQGVGHQFQIVGVVTSPGLDIASKFFDIGENYVDQAVNSVFGSRSDLISRFGNDSVNLVQIAFDPGADADETMRAIRNLRGTGILAGGTATAMKTEIRTMLEGTLRVFSLVAIGAMLVACFGVANVIIAGVRARSFEFGVLRASGASRGMLARLVLGEGLIIAIAAAILGTALGLQGAWGGQTVTASSIGIEFAIRPPWAAMGWSVLVVTAITLAAALPSALGLLSKRPRELLALGRG
jgi:putative ABC transport system permease protein